MNTLRLAFITDFLCHKSQWYPILSSIKDIEVDFYYRHTKRPYYLADQINKAGSVFPSLLKEKEKILSYPKMESMDDISFRDYDVVWQYINRGTLLPYKIRKLNKDIKLMVQYDFEGWKYCNYTLPPEVKTVARSVDVFCTIFVQKRMVSEWKKRGAKQVKYLPLPYKLEQYDKLEFKGSLVGDYWLIDTGSCVVKLKKYRVKREHISKYKGDTKISAKVFSDVFNMPKTLAIMKHTTLNSIIPYKTISVFNNSTLVFQTRYNHPIKIREELLPKDSLVTYPLGSKLYLYMLSQVKVALEDNYYYSGWSRFGWECAKLGIPCVGSNLNTTVCLFFPKLVTAHGDWRRQVSLLNKLVKKRKFSREIVTTAKELVDEHDSKTKDRLLNILNSLDR